MNPYHGQVNCQRSKLDGWKCTNKAYFAVIYPNKTIYTCGMHKIIPGTTYYSLDKDPNKSVKNKEKLANHLETIETFRKNTPGNLDLFQMKLMKNIQHKEGYITIFPNNQHKVRKDGLCFPELSSMNLGPVDHKQPSIPGIPDLPLALNLENFCCGNKLYQNEIDSKGNPTWDFYMNQLQLYLDPTPHQYKTGYDKMIPICTVWRDKNGILRSLGYIESRQIYCTFYERLVINHPDFLRLLWLRNNGYNLLICGYNAYPMELTSDGIEKAYLNPDKPFSHERVLISMLLLNPNEYPWRKHKTLDF